MHTRTCACSQTNLGSLEEKAKEFEAKLAYERKKFEAHDKESKAAEKQFAGVEKEFKVRGECCVLCVLSCASCLSTFKSKCMTRILSQVSSDTQNTHIHTKQFACAQAIQKALGSAQEEFKNFERKDAKCQIELKTARTKVSVLFFKVHLIRIACLTSCFCLRLCT